MSGAGLDTSGWDTLIKKAVGDMSETESMTKELGESRHLQRAIAEKLITDKPPPPPETPQPPAPMPPMQQRSPMEAFGGAAAVLGILGGLASSSPLTASLKAATGAMNGYRQRDIETYQQNYQQWKAQSEYAEQLAEWQQRRYREAYDQYKDNHDQLTAALSAIAAADKDMTAAHALKTGDLSSLESLLNFRDQAIDRYRSYLLEAKRLGETRSMELQAADELKRTTDWQNAPPEKKVQMLEELHGAFQKDAMLFGGQSQSPTTGVHGEEFLKTLKPDIAAQVKALAEGRLAFPSGFALRSPYWQQMLQAVSQYDPGFDAVNYNARAKTRADFTSGQAARNITSFNTVMGHLDTLSRAWDKLDNGEIPAINSLRNMTLQQSGDPRIQSFNLARNAVGDELERAFRGTGGNVTEIEQWKQTLDAAASPETQKAVIQQGLELLKSRIDAIGEQYNRGMGVTSDPLNLLNPHSREVYNRLAGTKESTIAEPKTQADYDALPSGSLFRDDEGVKRKP
jgi:hypothetical protein